MIGATSKKSIRKIIYENVFLKATESDDQRLKMVDKNESGCSSKTTLDIEANNRGELWR
jgi:hypothetical protein